MASTSADAVPKEEKREVGVFEVVAAHTGRRYRLKLRGPAIDYTLLDEEDNPCSFFQFELKIAPKEGAGGPKPLVMRGFLDEQGHIRIDPVPPGTAYTFTFIDELGNRLKAVELRQGKDGLGFVAEAPEAEPPPSQGWKKKT